MDTLKEYLDEQTALMNTPAFIDSDPVQFPRRYQRLQDIEIVAFTVATISWGRREMILRDAERMLAKFGDSPYDFVMNGGHRTLGTANVHRTFFEPDLAYMLLSFNKILTVYGSIEGLLRHSGAADSDAPAWEFARALGGEMVAANGNTRNNHCLPTNLDTAALKRINMALRWLVRTDGIVDLGVWTALKPSQLYIPLDVHVSRTARELGVLRRKSNDRKATEELTATLRRYCPEDPVKYDFALFGAGINAR
jgi:uncharacterized protein (TIGR02757 family)